MLLSLSGVLVCISQFQFQSYPPAGSQVCVRSESFDRILVHVVILLQLFASHNRLQRLALVLKNIVTKRGSAGNSCAVSRGEKACCNDRFCF